MYPDPSTIAVASFTGQQPNTVPSASGAPTGNEGTPVVPAAPVSTPVPAPAPQPTPEPVIPQGSPVSSADLYAQQQAAAMAARNGQPAPQPNQPATPPVNTALPPAQPQPAPAQAQPTTQTVRDYARSLGFQGTEQYQDDGSFVQAMVQRQQQLAWQLQQMQQNPLPAQPAAQPQPAAPAKPKLWDPPEWKPEWMHLLQRDTQGNVTAVPGADPAIVSKYQAMQTYQRTFAQRFLENPQQMIGAMVEDRAKEIAETAVQQRLGQHTEQQQAQSYIAQNQGWLFAQDGSGRQVRNQATGQPVLSPAGQRFYGHLQQAAQLGIPAAAQQRYAEAQLRAELATAQLQAQAAGQVNNQQRQQVIDANRQPNLGGSTYGAQPGPGMGQPQNASASLKDQLQFALQQAGVTDAHINGAL